VTQSCRTCKFLDVKPGERRMQNRMYGCLAPIPPKPAMPESADNLFNWPEPGRRKYTCPNYGVTCPAHQPLNT